MRKETIIAICALALSVLFLSLTSLWAPFSVFSSVLFLTGISVPCYYSIKSYYGFKKEIKEQRLVDAFLKQDENPTENIKDFSYDKKTERAIKRVNRNQFTSMFSLIAVWVLALVLLVLSIKITFFA